jgi:hypothetical protein
VDAIDATEGVLRSLATRELAVADVADDAGHTRIRLLLPTWEDYLRIAVEDLLPPRPRSRWCCNVFGDWWLDSWTPPVRRNRRFSG